ncbi:hypothetical protein TGARI_239083 [Toxoplasma gondii ARI]|uniref:Uncharacterized protein n=1 Tax=Toxoplasma gondii ARI TaxID=1074872 RepID=A0A139XMP7_TOXGO|nr:hypothetical protein TGARI_239083 [Toxoplasma gondii ARI]
MRSRFLGFSKRLLQERLPFVKPLLVFSMHHTDTPLNCCPTSQGSEFRTRGEGEKRHVRESFLCAKTSFTPHHRKLIALRLNCTLDTSECQLMTPQGRAENLICSSVNGNGKSLDALYRGHIPFFCLVSLIADCA